MIKAHHRPNDPYYFTYHQGWIKYDDGWERVEVEDYLLLHSKDFNTSIRVQPHFQEIEITGSPRDAALLFATFIRNQINERDVDTFYCVPLKKILKFSDNWHIRDGDAIEFLNKFNSIITTVLLLS